MEIKSWVQKMHKLTEKPCCQNEVLPLQTAYNIALNEGLIPPLGGSND